MNFGSQFPPPLMCSGLLNKIKESGLGSASCKDPFSSFSEDPHIRGPKIGGVDPSWLNFAFLGRPDFQSRSPEVLILTGKSCFSNRALVKAIFEAPKCL